MRSLNFGGRQDCIFNQTYFVTERKKVDQRQFIECKFTGCTSERDELVKIEFNLSTVCCILIFRSKIV